MTTTRVTRDTPWWGKMQMYWLEDQVTIAFHSKVSLSKGKEAVIKSLKLDALNQFVNQRGFTLISSNPNAAPSMHDEETGETRRQENKNPADDPIITFFPTPTVKGEDQGTLVVGFFDIRTVPRVHAIQESMSMHGSGDAHADESNTRQVVKLINSNLDKMRLMGQIPILAAMPNWLGGSTGCVIHTCPTIPPIPISSGSSSTSSSGRWPIRLPDLSADMQSQTGNGVTVFVLDSMPEPDLIQQAAKDAGSSNLLLHDIAAQVQEGSIAMNYQTLSSLLAEDAEDQLVTGKDIYGRLYGFSMPDHGLFITGILHDLAPKAKIEYIRVFNDFGVGDLKTLINTLSVIQKRMLPKGDLYQKPVVINLGLVIGPAEEDLVRAWFGEDCSCNAEELVEMISEIERLKLGLHLVIQNLTELGAVVVAAVGNDSNAQQWQGSIAEHMQNRAPARYPAAFPEVIAVGAVDKNDRATKYSNYPQMPPRYNGIATYSGEIPESVPHPGAMTTADPASIDGLLGVYTASTFPALSADDRPDEYPAPADNHAWAYWSGTSFATPIISAVAARVLEKLTSAPNPLPTRLWPAEVQRAITTAEGQAEILTGAAPLPLQPDFGFSVGMLRAHQREGEAEV